MIICIFPNFLIILKYIFFLVSIGKYKNNTASTILNMLNTLYNSNINLISAFIINYDSLIINIIMIFVIMYIKDLRQKKKKILEIFVILAVWISLVFLW